jgi:hypothetical protein
MPVEQSQIETRLRDRRTLAAAAARSKFISSQEPVEKGKSRCGAAIAASQAFPSQLFP